jgi:hypothetical protein
MGITAASMLPGLDGTWEELKERNFSLSRVAQSKRL